MKILDAEVLGFLDLRVIPGPESNWRLLDDFPIKIKVEAEAGEMLYLGGAGPVVLPAGISEHVMTVPAGFITNLASVPRLPLMFLFFGGKARESSVPHDYLYSLHMGDREIADAVFFALMAHEEGPITRALMWAGVRVGGWSIWERRAVPTIPEASA